MPKSRGRKPKVQTRTVRRRPGVPAQAAARGGGRLRGEQSIIVGLLEHAPPEQLVENLVPHVWAGIAEGEPANVCVDACQTIRYAYGHLGVRAETVLVDLVVREADGSSVLHGTPEPSWSQDGTRFDGHCILHLPETQRFADPTVEQFPGVREQGGGPLVGRAMAATAELPPGAPLPAGMHIGVQRGRALLMYTVSGLAAAEVIDSQPVVRRHLGDHYRAGAKLASLVLDLLRRPGTRHRARQIPYPRLRAQLEAIGQAPLVQSGRELCFALPGPGGVRHVNLEDVPLPVGTPGPPAVPELPGI